MKKKIAAIILCIGMIGITAGCSNGVKGVTLGEYKGISVEASAEDGAEAESLEVTDEELEAEINAELEQTAEQTEVSDRAAKEGDIVNIDFKGLLNGEAFDGGTAEAYDLELGSGSFIPGFEEQLVGAKKGDKKEVNLTFPEDYGVDELNGQPVVFEVTVNSIKTKNLPDLTDEWVQGNTDFKTVDEYKADYRKTLEETKKTDAENSKMEDAWAKVLENAKVDDPTEEELKTLTQEVIDSYHSFAEMMGYTYEDLVSSFYGVTAEEFEKKEAIDMAKDSFKERMVAKAITTEEKLEPSESEYKELYTKYAQDSGYESTEALFKEVKEEQVKNEILLQKAKEFVGSNIKK